MSACAIAVAILLRVRECCVFVPKAVFKGFTVSVAFTVSLDQTDFAIGRDPEAFFKIAGLELFPGIWKSGSPIRAFGSILPTRAIFFLVGFATMCVLFKTKPSIPWMASFTGVACFLGALCDEGALGVAPLDLPTRGPSTGS